MRILILFYLVNSTVIFYFFNKNSKNKAVLKLQIQDLQEKINILTNQNSQELGSKLAIQDKIGRYHSLKKIIEEINQNLSLDIVADYLTGVTFSSIANNKGVCILYLVDNQKQPGLKLFKAKKEDENLIIKAKEGDIFDIWVLRHTSVLFIEDIRKDFRFDLEKLKTQELRSFLSLISSPLITENRFMGILRLDNLEPAFYSQYDLRLLVTICDLGAVALENSELFQRTQDLAIHDGLTSLYTKGYFLDYLKEECKRSLHQGTPLSLLMLDIDHFKNCNDKFGHTVGDIVLKNLSLNLIDALKDSNPFISRFGGEEFCVVLNLVDKKKAHQIAEKIRLGIEAMKINLRRRETNITISIGVASFPADAKDSDELIFKADEAMYKAKEKGRNRVINA